MIDRLIKAIFSWEKLRLAIFDEVHMYDRIYKMIEESKDTPNKYWMEGDLWYGWSYNPEFNRYYFYDTGSKSLMDLMDKEGIL